MGTQFLCRPRANTKQPTEKTRPQLARLAGYSVAFFCIGFALAWGAFGLTAPVAVVSGAFCASWLLVVLKRTPSNLVGSTRRGKRRSDYAPLLPTTTPDPVASRDALVADLEMEEEPAAEPSPAPSDHQYDDGPPNF